MRLGAGDRPHLVQGVSAPMGVTLIRSEPGYIPWTAVAQWADRHGLSEEDEALLDHCCRALDHDYREWWAEKMKPPDAE